MVTNVVIPNSVPAITASGPLNFCKGSTVTLTASYPDVKWNTGDSSQSITVDKTGTYWAYFKYTNCANLTSLPVRVSVATKPAAIDFSQLPTDSICYGDSLVLSAGATYPFYQWSTGETTQKITVKKTGAYWVRVANQNFCWSDTLTGSLKRKGVTLFPAGGSPNDTITLVLDPANICNNLTTGPNTYRIHSGVKIGNTQWSNQVSTLDANEPRTHFYQDLTDGLWKKKIVPYSYYSTSATDTIKELDAVFNGGLPVTGWFEYSGRDYDNACSDFFIPFPLVGNGVVSTARKVVVRPGYLPTVTALNGQTDICSGTRPTLQGPAGSAWLWSNGAKTQNITPSVPGNYSVRVVSNGCTSLSSSPINVTIGTTPSAPTISAGGPTRFFAGGSVTLTASSANGYLWSTGETTQSIVADTAGSYTVRAISGSCTSVASSAVVVSFKPSNITAPVVTALGPTKFCPGGSVTLTGPALNGAPATISTLAQTGIAGPLGLDLDALGNVYVADAIANKILKITSAGLVSVLAGTGVAGYKDGISTTAQFNIPGNVKVDKNGNVYVSEYGNHTIRKITPSGLVSTFAGNGTQGFVNGNGSAAKFNRPDQMAFDAAGNLYVAEEGNYVIRKIDPAGNVTTFAGSGTAGLADGNGTAAQFAGPIGITMGPSGNLYVSDWQNGTIRLITPNADVSTFVSGLSGLRTITCDAAENLYMTDANGNLVIKISNSGTKSTLAGNGIGNFTDGLTSFNFPYGIVSDASGTIYVADKSNSRVRIISQSLTGTYLWNTGATTQSITVNSGGNYSLQVLSGPDTSPFSTPVTVTLFNPVAPVIRASGPTSICNGSTVTLTGPKANSYFWSNGATTQYVITGTAGDFTLVTVDTNGCITPNSTATVTVIPSPATPVIATSGPTVFCPGGRVTLSAPVADAYVWSNGSTARTQTVSNPGTYSLQIVSGSCTSAGSNAVVVALTPRVLVPAVANICAGGTYNFRGKFYNTPGYYADTVRNAGVCDSVFALSLSVSTLATPTVTALGPTAFCGGDSVTLSGPYDSVFVSTLAGSGIRGFADSSSATARFNSPRGVAADASGSVYVADYTNNRIRKIDPSGKVSTFAGNGTRGFADGSAANAQFYNPAGVATDAAGNVYVADYGNNRIRKIDPLGNVSTYAGNGTKGFADGSAANAQFSGPNGVATDLAGNVFVADYGNNRIRKIDPAGNVSTYAGDGNKGFADGPAANAEFSGCMAVATDKAGNVYVADNSNHRIRKIDPSGNVSTLAGNGIGAFADGFGTNAEFYFPSGVSADALGNVYVADNTNFRVRKIDPTGNVSTLAGNGIRGSVDASGANAKFGSPAGVATDASGNLYIADAFNNKIRKIVKGFDKYLWLNGDTTQNVTVKSSGSYTLQVISGGCTSAASVPVLVTVNQVATPVITASGPTTFCTGGSVTLSAPLSDAYIWSNGSTAQTLTSNISGVYSLKVVSGGCTSASSSAVVVTLNPTVYIPTVSNVCVGSGYAFRGKVYNNSGIYYDTVRTAGICDSVFVLSLTLSSPSLPTVTASGPIKFCAGDSVTLNGPSDTATVGTLAGNGNAALTNGKGLAASFNLPYGLAYSQTNGSIYVADVSNNAIRVITPDSTVGTLAGGGGAGYLDGVASVAKFNNPFGVAYDDLTRNVYVADFLNNCIRKITPAGIVSTLAGSPTAGYADGQGTAARFNGPKGVAVDPANGNIFVADANGNYIRKITPSGLVSTYAGNGNAGFADGPGTAAQFAGPRNLTVDRQGNVWVTDTDNNRIRKIDNAGNVTTFAGSGLPGSQDGIGINASFNGPRGIVVSDNGNIYVADAGGNLIRRITAAGAVTTLAGSGLSGYLDGKGRNAAFGFPWGIVEDNAGNLIIGDSQSNRIRTVKANDSFNGYLWSTGETTRNITVKTSGSYTLQTLSGICKSAASAAVNVVVTPISAPTITTSGSTNICQFESVTLNAPVADSYLWSDGSTAQSLVVSLPGSFALRTVTNGCTSALSSPVVVNVNPKPATPVITTSSATTFCKGGSVTLKSDSATAYIWSNGTTSRILTTDTSGTFSVRTINSYGCTSAVSLPVLVVVNPVPVANISVSGPTTFCKGGSVTLKSESATAYIWSNGSTSRNLTTDTSGTFTVRTINANGCTSAISSPIKVTVNPLPAKPVISASGATTFCKGANVTLKSDSATAYVWSNGITSRSLTTDTSGTFTVRTVNASGCTSAVSTPVIVTVNQAATPLITASGPTTFCQGSNVTLTADVASGYIWSNGKTTRTLTTDTAGTFSVRTINANGCTSLPSIPVVVKVNPVPGISIIGAKSLCQGGSVTLKTDTGTAYIWSNGSTTSTLTTSSAGTYSVRVVYAGGCTSAVSSPFVLTVNPIPATPAITTSGSTTFCQGGTVTLKSDSASAYIWSNGTKQRSLSTDTAGTFTVRTINANGCTSAISSPVTVTVNPLPAVPQVTVNGATTFCPGGSVTLSPNVASAYLWSNGSTNRTLIANKSGSYSVRTINANGCTSAASIPVVVTVIPTPTPAISANGPTTFCAGGNVTLQADLAAAYIWSDGTTSRSLTTNTAGTFSVRTVNASGCTSAVSNAVVVKVNPVPQISINGASNLCQGGRVTLKTDTGTAYLWSNGSTLPTLTTDTAGTFSVRVVYFGGCTSAVSTPFVVTVNPLPATPVVTANAATTFCKGGSVTLKSDSATAYIWSNGTTSRTLTTDTSGTFTVRTVNASGCTSAVSSPMVVTVNPLPATPVVTANAASTFCKGASVTLKSDSATAYIWSNGGTSRTLTTDTSGTFTVRTVNASGCTSAVSSPMVVTVNPLPATPVVTANAATTFCKGGSVTLKSDSATTYIWSNGTTSRTLTTDTSGTFTVRTVNASGCTSALSSPVIVNVNPLPTVPTVTGNGPTTFCSGDSVTLSGPNGFGNYIWSNGATTASIKVKAAGSYTLRVVAGTGCTSLASVPTVVTVNNAPAVPVISYTSTRHDSITASTVATSYLWYYNNNPITASTRTISVAGNPGAYKVIAVTSPCSSAVSNVFNVVGTSTLAKAVKTEVYPNPFTEGYTIRCTGVIDETATITMIDELGRTVFSQTVGFENGLLNVNPQGLSAGVYLLQIKTDKTVSRHQLLKQ